MTDDDELLGPIDIDIDPSKTKLETLLLLAENHRTGTILVEGESDGEVQWGIVVVCSEDAKDLMELLQNTVDNYVASKLSRTAN